MDWELAYHPTVVGFVVATGTYAFYGAIYGAWCLTSKLLR